ncbi:hypothetical protein [Natrinema marinum]|uniref:hypothetical protein n=1 Tax=Natrinema marinum TaxID=2961598 RepID=UPI0020C8AAD2|nr:hypothetical protein [Natrinema marinum]
MSLAGGPRLDRPSAIGDEGRARATSLWIATLAVVAAVGLVGVAIGEPSLLPTLGLVVGLTVAGVGLLERHGFVEQLVAHAFLLTVGTAFSLIVLAAPLVAGPGLAVSGCALALAGTGAAWADIGGEKLKTAATGSVLGYVSMLASSAAVTVLLAFGYLATAVVGRITGVSSPIGSLTGFLIVGAGTAVVVRLSLRWLPIVALTPRDRRPAVERRLASVRRYLTWTISGAVVAVIALSGLVLGGATARLSARQPALSGGLEVLSSPIVVWPIVAVGAVSAAAGVIALVLRRLTREADADATRRTAAIVVGVGLSLPFLLGVVLLIASNGVVVGPVLLAGALLIPLLVGPLAAAFVFGSGAVCTAVGLLPARATGPTIAATGLVVAAIGVESVRPLLAFGCIAAAVLVWDLSTFGLGVTAELGHVPETRRLELFHGAIAVGVGVAAVAVVAGLAGVGRGVFGGGGAAGAALVVVLGVLLLLVPLRG